MTHLRIEQNNGVIEEVSSSIITKLYEIAHAGLDVSSNLQGRLHTPISYRAEVQYLTANYPNLYITSDDYAIPFEDPNMVTYLNSIGVGSNGMITENLAAAATVVANSANTTVTKFNELRYFTNITESRGGWTGSSLGYTRFAGWTALEEVDISNFTSLGHVGGYAYEDTLGGCTALKTVTASDKLTRIGCRAFYGCTNLEHIIGLSGTILVSTYAFYNCSKLPDEDIADVEFLPAYEGNNLRGNSAFEGTNFTEITLSSNTTEIPSKMFYSCRNLETVNGLDSITAIGDQAFRGCSNLQSIDINWNNVTKIGVSTFRDCSNLGTNLTLELNLTNLTGHFGSSFRGTKFKKIILHAPSEVLGDQNNEPLFGLEYTEYIDVSDFPLPVVDGRTLSTTWKDNNLITCIYPSNTNYLTSDNFKTAVGTYRYMILLSTTPPTLHTGDHNNPTSSWLPQGSTLHIYVPDSAKADYLADTDWASITGTSGDTIVDRLHGLSELPAGVWTTGLASLYLSAAQLVTS